MMRRAVLSLLPVFALQAAGQDANWNLRGHIPLNQVIVQSHRGAGNLMPENSIEAFELAWKLGTVPEADLRTTSDGVIVAFHDNDFKRILPNATAAMQSKGIQDLTWSEVRKFDIGVWKGAQFAGQRVPRMKDVYQILKKHPVRKVYIDIKNIDLEQLTRESKGVHAQLILASTDYDLVQRWKTVAPDSFTLLWMGAPEEQLRKRLDVLRAEKFTGVTQLQIHVRPNSNGTITPSEQFLRSTGEELRSHGILFQVLPYEITDPAKLWRLMDLGVASFATDFPDVMMKAIRDYYAQRTAK